MGALEGRENGGESTGSDPPILDLGSPVEAVSVWVKGDLAGRVRGDLNR